MIRILIIFRVLRFIFIKNIYGWILYLVFRFLFISLYVLGVFFLSYVLYLYFIFLSFYIIVIRKI